MGKFTIEGVDDATGMQTSLVLEATTQDEALKVARSRGIRPRRTEFIPPAFTGQEPASHADIARLVEEIQGLRKDTQAVAELHRNEGLLVRKQLTHGALASAVAGGVFMGVLLLCILAALINVFFGVRSPL